MQYSSILCVERGGGSSEERVVALGWRRGQGRGGGFAAATVLLRHGLQAGTTWQAHAVGMMRRKWGVACQGAAQGGGGGEVE